MDDHERSYRTFEEMIGRQAAITRAPKRRHRPMLWFAVGAVIGGLLMILFALAGEARGATPSCSITVPAIHAQADGSGTETGHVHGTCTFGWHSRNLIQFKDRWHTLGVEEHQGGAAGAYVIQSVDRDDYHGDGYWREVVMVYNAAGTLIVRIVGPVTEFAA